MRLYAIPIVKNRWAYYCHSNIPTTSSLTKIVDWSSKKWDSLEKAETNSWKKKLHVKGSNIMNQLDYQEWFLKSIPSEQEIEEPVKKIVLNYPSVLEKKEIKSNLSSLLKERIPYHKKYMWYSTYWVPITCTFVIVPLVPNIPLAYNLFRLYSHYKAYKGSQHLNQLVDSNRFSEEVNPTLENIFQNIKLKESNEIIFSKEFKRLYLEKSKELNLLLENDIEGVLNQQDIKNIVNNLNVPGLELELNRARSQILKSIVKEKFV